MISATSSAIQKIPSAFKIQTPDYLQNQYNTTAYADTLNAICHHRIIKDMVHRTISNAVTSALIAKLTNGVIFPERKSNPPTPLNLMKCEHDLKTKSPYQVWQAMDPSLRPKGDQYLSPEILSKIHHNLQQLQGEGNIIVNQIWAANLGTC